ncbi:MAG: MGMT family protein [Candidatus Peregrinibacteria bacterium]|nr:MGMT family protein [Candidatus Peregrinibacteria bacterium]
MQSLLALIPNGKVTSYKELARAMGTKGYRYVGQLLNRNPEPDKYPCFKVVAADGKLGGFAYGSAEKIKRLEAEGIPVKRGRIEEFEQRLYRFQN